MHDINNAGWIVGDVGSAIGSPPTVAYVQKPGQAIQIIGSLGGSDGWSAAWSINSSNRVLGSSSTLSGEPRYFSWTSFGGMKDAGPAATWASRGVISDKGRVAGIDSINGRLRAVTQYRGIYNVLPVLPNGRRSDVYGVNACGTIVGMITTSSGAQHAVRWRRVVGTPPIGICD